MNSAPPPDIHATQPRDNETVRLNALLEYRLLDTPNEPQFDAITTLAAEIAGVPISVISLIDQDRQWFKSNYGLPGVTETARDVAFCAHAILQSEPLIVPDALNDPHFAKNPLVLQDPCIRFYAGIPLINVHGHGLGTLCVIDRVPRNLSDSQVSNLRHLAEIVLALFEARVDRDHRAASEAALQQSEQRLRTLNDAVPALISYIDRAQHYVFVNKAYEHWFGKPRDQIIGLSMEELLGPDSYARAKVPFERALAGETVTFENHAVGQDNRHVQASYVPDVGSQGVQGVFVLGSDISSHVEQQLRHQNAVLSAMSATLREDIEAERKRIARTLHDQLGQDLTAIRVHVSRISRRWGSEPALLEIAEQIQKILLDAGTSMRRTIADLRPLVLDDLGITVAAKALGFSGLAPVTLAVCAKSGCGATASAAAD